MLEIKIRKNDDGTFTAFYFVAGQGSEQSTQYATVAELQAGIPTLFGIEQVEAETEAKSDQETYSANLPGTDASAGDPPTPPTPPQDGQDGGQDAGGQQ